MNKTFTKWLAAAMLLLLITPPMWVWGAEGDVHDMNISQNTSLNNSASIPSINIAAQSYSVKKVTINWRYNKTITNPVTIEVLVGGTSWGTQTITGNTTADAVFEGSSTVGAIVINFTNNTGSGTGHGTFYVNSVKLTEGSSGGGDTPTTYTVTYNAGEGTGNAFEDPNGPYAANATVTLLDEFPNAFTAPSGYEWSGWSVSNNITPENNEFTMPASNVTVTAQYTQSEGGSGNTSKITITQNQIENFTNTYAWYDWSADGVSGKVYAYKNSGMQFNSSKNGYWIYNSTAIPGIITSVKMTKASGTDRSWTLKAGTSALTQTNDGTQIGESQTVGASGATWNVSGTYNHFLLFVSGGSTVIGSIEITYVASTDPIIVASNPAELAYNATSGEFGYSITNPTSATLSAVSNSDWITNVVVDGTNSKVTFSTSANTAYTQRTGTITLSYTGASDKVVTITQAAAPQPTISADDVNIVYDAENGSISYTLANGTGSVSATVTTGGWLTLGTITESAVPFTCSANTETTARTATVTLSYSGASDKVVTITQAGRPNHISEITASGTAYTVVGTVVATNSRGFVIGDGTGYVYTYLNSAPSQAVNENVKIAGTTGTYGQIIQFTSSATITAESTSPYDGSPAATVINTIPDYSTGLHLSTYLQFEGDLEYSNSNYYITVGDNRIQISYPTSTQSTALSALDGKNVRVKGYFSGNNSSGYFSVMMESVEEVTNPTLAVDPATAQAFTYVVGNGPSDDQMFTVTGTHLVSADITATVSSDYEITDNTDYSSSVTIASGDFVSVRLKAGLAKGEHNGTLTLSSTDATDVVINLSGNVTGQIYTISVEDDITGGTIEADLASAEEGATVTLTATPDAAYTFGSWTVYKDDMETMVTVTENQFTMPDCEVYVTATFNAKPTYAITCVASPDAGGVIEASPASAYEGQTVTLSYMAETGYNLSSIVITKTSDGTATGITPAASGDDYTFTMPGYAVTATATFEEIVDYATLPFEWDDTSTPTGITNSGVSTYDNSPRLKFDGTGDYIILKINEAPGTLTFDIKGNSFSGGTFKVQTSADGLNYTDLKSYTSLGSTQSESFDDLESTVRYIKWVYTNKSSGNVALGNIKLLKALEKVATPAFSPEAGTYTSAQNVTISCETADATIYYTTDGSTPTTSSAEYTNAVSVNVTQTLKAIAVKEGMANSAIATAEYVITIPSIAVSSNTVEADAAETEGTITVTYNYIANVDSEVLFYEADGETEADYSSWLDADIDSDNNIYYLISNNTGSARTGYMKVHQKNTDVYSELITINQATLMITGAISFGSASGSTNINSTSVSGNDAMGNTWTITTAGTTSFTPNSAYAQVGSSSNPATSITFTTTLAESVSIADFKVKFGGFKETAGTITLKVGENTVGTGSLNGTDDVTVVNSSMAEGTTLKVTVTDIAKGVKCYYIDYTILSYDIYGSTEITNFTIPADEILTIYDGGVLTITNSLTNEGTAANLVIKDGGQLKVYDNGAKDGGVQATMEKDITAWTTGTPVGGWYFIASPVNVNNLNPSTVTNMLTADNGDDRTYDLYKYVADNEVNEESKPWYNYRAHSGDFVLANGQGYLYANASDLTLAFAGAVKPYNTVDNTANQVAVSTGWNLIGNPFTFNTFVNQNYYKLNTARTAIEAVENNAEIAPCTGIIVKATEACNVTFTETASRGLNGNVGIMLTKAGTRSNATLDNAIVSFNEGSQLEKFYFMQQNANLYIPQGKEEYAIVNAQAQGEMPVNFRANANGQYTLTVNAENVEMNYLHLIDNMTGADIDLLATPSYTFNAKTYDYESRFRLVFAANSSEDTNSENASFAFFANGNLIINNEGEATLQVFDMLGHQLECRQVYSAFSIPDSAFAPGVYVIRLVNGNNVKTQKVVVK